MQDSLSLVHPRVVSVLVVGQCSIVVGLGTMLVYCWVVMEGAIVTIVAASAQGGQNGKTPPHNTGGSVL